MPKHFLEGAQYFNMLVDDATQKVRAYLLKVNDEAIDTFIWWSIEVKLKSGHKVMTLRSHIGGKYTSSVFTKYQHENGIHHQWDISGYTNAKWSSGANEPDDPRKNFSDASPCHIED